MFLYQSNRLEHLFAALLAVLRTPLDDPLTPEFVVVQNQGMAQWVGRQLALAEGIAANIRFPLPARFFWDQLASLTPAPAEARDDLFGKPVLRWRVARLLPGWSGDPAFAEIDAYLADDPDGRKLHQLSGLIAATLDQYLIYRPDLLDRWRQGEDRHWQAALWRRLTGEGQPLRARLAAQLREQLTAPPAPGLLPQRAHLFGLNAIAPAYLECLAVLGPHMDIHLYSLGPCRQYWGDLVPARHQARLRARAGRDGRDPGLATAYLEEGHPLLASLGRTGQEFFQQLLELPDEALQTFDLFQENNSSYLLAAIQNGILDLAPPDPAERRSLAADDRSVQFHRCCSTLREVQVLHDRLLDLFQTLPGLTPGDILVCAPDIGDYASAVAGVFGEAGRERFIPWSLADQSPAGEESLVRVFLDLLNLLAGRFAAPEVLALCESRALLERFGLTPESVPQFADWVRETGIHWGLDARHRDELGLHASQPHSWRFGLDRLLLGAMMGECDGAVAGRLPHGRAASADPEELGGFALLIDTLARWQSRLREARPPAAWCADLLSLLDECLAPEGDDNGLAALQAAIASLRADCRLAGFERPLSAAVVRTHLEDILTSADAGRAFLGGRVTFCNMVPMRSVPFRVLCLLGMNDQAFPRSQHPPSFDFMAAFPRPGDRNRRNDDCYLFLESLLSARDLFYISWVGASQRDESLLPASSVVLELQDLIDQLCRPVDGVPASAVLTTAHPLQPFSLSCFDGSPATASYNPAWLPAGRRADQPPFFSRTAESDAGPEQEEQEAPLDRLIRFWRHPIRFFLEQRLGLGLFRDETAVEESEPFAPDALERYQLRQESASALLAGRTAPELYRTFRAKGLLSQGQLGRCQFEALVAETAAFTGLLAGLLDTPQPALSVDCPVGPFRLTGLLAGLHRAGLVAWRVGRLRTQDLMALWIGHLCLNLLAPEPLQPWSHFLEWRDGEARVHHLAPVDDPARLLRPLLDGYRQGQGEPLPFFPETSRAWVEAKEEQRVARAGRAWTGSDYQAGEGDDPACRLAFPDGALPLGPAFEQLAGLLTPILTSLDTGKETWHASA